MPTNHTMPKRHLGHTDIEITPIGSGGNQFSGNKGMYRVMGPALSQEQVNAIIQAALDGGVNWFDTAEMYGSGQSERALAGALKAAGKKDDEVLVATKWSPFFRTAGNITRTIDERRRFLDGYTIDLYMIHQPLGFSSREAEMNAMADLVEAGKIRSIGVSNFNVDQMRRAHAALEKRGLPLAANQVQYSLLRRKIETNGVLDAAKELGVTIIAWTPLASGVLTGKFHRDPGLIGRKSLARRMMARRHIERGRPVVEALEEIATKYDATPAQVALNWLITFQGETVVAIPGASKAHQAEQNAGAMRLRLSEEDMARLDEISRTFR